MFIKVKGKAFSMTVLEYNTTWYLDEGTPWVRGGGWSPARDEKWTQWDLRFEKIRGQKDLTTI